MSIRPVPLFLSVLAALVAAGCSKVSPAEAAAAGQRALAEGDFAAAEPALRIVAKANPKSWPAAYNLGMAQLGLGKASEAARTFEKAVSLAEGEEETVPLRALAEARRRAGDPDAAFAALKAAEAKVYRTPWLLADLGAAEMDRKNPGAAKAYLLDALESDPSEPVAVFNLAVLRSRGEDFDQTESSAGFARFLASPRSAEFPERRQDAVRRLAALDKSRPPSLQDRIDALLLDSHNPSLPAEARLRKSAEAVRLDWSNASAIAWHVRLARENGRADEAARYGALGRALFPGDARFGEARP